MFFIAQKIIQILKLSHLSCNFEVQNGVVGCAPIVRGEDDGVAPHGQALADDEVDPVGVGPWVLSRPGGVHEGRHQRVARADDELGVGQLEVTVADENVGADGFPGVGGLGDRGRVRFHGKHRLWRLKICKKFVLLKWCNFGENLKKIPHAINILNKTKM